MFKVVDEPLFRYPVTVRVPADGTHEIETFHAVFRVIPTDQVERYDLASEAGTGNFLKAAISSVEDVAREDGTPWPYDDALRDRLLVIPYVRQALLTAYLEGVSGARQGN